MKAPLRRASDGIRLEVRVIPRSRRLGWGGIRAGRLVVRLTAAPADDKANRQLARFLAAEFQVPVGSIVITRGAHSREKSVLAEGAQALPAQLETLLADSAGLDGR